MLFHNAHILTQNPEMPIAEAFLVENGKIAWIGLEKDAPLSLEKTDLGGKTVLPGFVDSHIHVWKVGNLLTYTLDVRGISSIQALQEKIRKFDEENPQNQWIQVRGFNEIMMAEGRMPTKEDLDAVSTEKPIYLLRTCAHIAVFNSKALELAQAHPQMKLPEGGIADLDENGQLTGVFRETAMGVITQHIPSFSAQQYADMIHAASAELLKHGVTSATDPGVLSDLLQIYQDLDAQNALKMRFNVMKIRLPDGGDTPLENPKPYFSEHLRIDTIKFFSDGGLSGKTAAVSRSYRDLNEFGILRFEEQHLYDLAIDAHKSGLRIAIHAIGDRAIEVVLNVYESLYTQYPSTQHHRIEHFGLPTDAQLKKAKALGISVCPQPIFIYEMGANFRKYLDDQVLEKTYPLRTFLDIGLTTSFSTDAPVVQSVNPFVGIQAALTRKDRTGEMIAAQEGVSIEEALYAYTMGGALVNGNAHEVGSLATGKFADFIVLNENPLKVLSENVCNILVEKTYLGGILHYALGMKK